MRVCFGLSSHDDLRTDFSLSTLAIDWCGCDVRVKNVRVPYLPKSRHILARTALEWECDALLLIDSDMVFPHDGFRRLLAHDKDIVGTFYRMRQPPHEVVGNWGTDEEVIPLAHRGLVQRKRTPLGFSLIRTEVFRQVPLPWFTNEWIPELEDYEPEDYAFCRKARAAGLSIWVDLDLSHELGHIGQVIHRW